MGTVERRSEIINLLSRRRHETIENLAFEFGVSEKTIRRDVEVLSLSEPIYTQAGRYGGGVYMMDGYSGNKKHMREEELGVLQKLSATAKEKAFLLTAEESKILDAIILQYSRQKAS